MNTFLFYNSWWRNLVLALICALLASPSVFAFKDIIHEKWLFFGGAMFGLGAIMFGYRFLDRRVKVKISELGVQDYRTNYGNIPWSEISEYRLWSVKGNDYITLTLRSPRDWLIRANAIGKVIASLIGKDKFKITIPLQNMAVKEAALMNFMTKMIELASANAQPGVQADVHEKP